jgi:hypothetical protein
VYSDFSIRPGKHKRKSYDVGASATARPLPIVEQGAAFPEIFLLSHLPVMFLVLAIFRIYIYLAIRKGHFCNAPVAAHDILI